jgi:hypothetical protein
MGAQAFVCGFSSPEAWAPPEKEKNHRQIARKTEHFFTRTPVDAFWQGLEIFSAAEQGEMRPS